MLRIITLIIVTTLLMTGCGNLTQYINNKNNTKTENAFNEQPILDSVQEGNFKLIIKSEKGIYHSNEPIKVKVYLLYEGPEDEVHINHAATPFNFTVVQLDGEIRLSRAIPAIRKESEWTKGNPLFDELTGLSPSKGSLTLDDLEGSLILPKGIYQVKVSADFYYKEKHYELPLSIKIKVHPK